MARVAVSAPSAKIVQPGVGAGTYAGFAPIAAASVSPPPAGNPHIPAGLSSAPTSFLGTGPGGGAAPPFWRELVKIVTPGSIIADLAAADATDSVIFANFAGQRNSWTDPSVAPCATTKRQFNQAKYDANVRAFTVAGGATGAQAAATTDGLARRRLIAYTSDDSTVPGVFCPILTPVQRNWMGLLFKSIWPGCITAERQDYTKLSGGGQYGPPVGGWTGLDYGWCQYEGPIHTPSAAYGTVTNFFQTQKSQLAGLGLGAILGANWADGGDNTRWDYLNNGSSLGRVEGNAGLDGPGFIWTSTSAPPSGNTRWLIRPQMIRDAADAAVIDLDCPAFNMWGYRTDVLDTDYFERADFVSACDYMINKFNTRAAWNGWRTPK